MGLKSGTIRDVGDKYFSAIIVIVLLANFVFILTDLADDISENMGAWHIVPEVLTAIATFCLVVGLTLKLRESREESTTLRQKIDQLEDEAHDWKIKTARYTQGLSEAIDEQMRSWGLTDAEKEVALLLLKGLSNKDVAEVRSTSEQTVKQHSSTIYRKSGLTSRAELSAFFLEDLLSPRTGTKERPTFVGTVESLSFSEPTRTSVP
jgi:DNA-binding CsgD family transcriptional regulator